MWSHASLLCHTEDGYSMIDLLPNNPIKDGSAFRASCDTLEALGAVFVKYAFHKTSGRPSSASSFQAVVLSKDGGGMSISCPYPSSMLFIYLYSLLHIVHYMLMSLKYTGEDMSIGDIRDQLWSSITASSTSTTMDTHSKRLVSLIGDVDENLTRILLGHSRM